MYRIWYRVPGGIIWPMFHEVADKCAADQTVYFCASRGIEVRIERLS